jgi:hypothetical protein
MGDPSALSLAPTGALGALMVVLAYIVREWRIGRQAAVTHFRTRAEAAEAERDRSFDEHVADREALARRVAALEEEVRRLREEHSSYIQHLTDRHRDEVRTLNRRLEVELRMEWRLRAHMAAHGVDLPPDLDPAHPEIPPDLGPSAPEH